jgi:hypothetical protein
MVRYMVGFSGSQDSLDGLHRRMFEARKDDLYLCKHLVHGASEEFDCSATLDFDYWKTENFLFGTFNLDREISPYFWRTLFSIYGLNASIVSMDYDTNKASSYNLNKGQLIVRQLYDTVLECLYFNYVNEFWCAVRNTRVAYDSISSNGLEGYIKETYPFVSHRDQNILYYLVSKNIEPNNFS